MIYMKKRKTSGKRPRGKGNPTRWKPFLKPAVPLDQIKGLSFNTPNIFHNDPSDTKKRILIFTPTTGLVRIEWVQARYGQIIPTNWSFVDYQQHLAPWLSVNYQLADAQNLMAREVVEGGYEWIIYCFPGNTLVETPAGGARIKDITEGMYVRTHTGEVRRVTKTMRRLMRQKDPLRELTTKHSTLRVTPEHPFYVRRGDEYAFVEAKDLRSDDMLLYPLAGRELDDALSFDVAYNSVGEGYHNLEGGSRATNYIGEVPVTKDLAYVLGLFLADGHVNRDGIAISFDDHETEQMEYVVDTLEAIFDRKASIVTSVPWSSQVRLSIRNLAPVFEALFGRGAAHKKVPGFVFSWNYVNRLSFLRGYIDGDGGEQGGGMTFISTSYNVTSGISDLARGLGLRVSEIREHAPVSSVIKSGCDAGRVIEGRHPAYSARIGKASWDRVLDHCAAEYRKGYLEIRLERNTRKAWSAGLVDNYVYNFEVEGDNSYIAGPAAVHNCEHDNVIPPDAFMRLNQYINDYRVPVVSGLYFLKSNITEPLLYRGRGTSHFTDWKLGDRVWVDGIPFGFRLEHAGFIKEAWKTSEDIVVNGIKTRRVFKQPSAIWYDRNQGGIVTKGGTTDLEWCTRIMKEDMFTKIGFPEYAKRKYPFLVDTNIFVKHIDQNGTVWPKAIPARFVPDNQETYKGREIME